MTVVQFVLPGHMLVLMAHVDFMPLPRHGTHENEASRKWHPTDRASANLQLKVSLRETTRQNELPALATVPLGNYNRQREGGSNRFNRAKEMGPARLRILIASRST